MSGNEHDTELLAGVMRALLADSWVGWGGDDYVLVDGWASLTPEQSAAVRRFLRKNAEEEGERTGPVHAGRESQA